MIIKRNLFPPHFKTVREMYCALNVVNCCLLLGQCVFKVGYTVNGIKCLRIFFCQVLRYFLKDRMKSPNRRIESDKRELSIDFFNRHYPVSTYYTFGTCLCVIVIPILIHTG